MSVFIIVFPLSVSERQRVNYVSNLSNTVEQLKLKEIVSLYFIMTTIHLFIISFFSVNIISVNPGRLVPLLIFICWYDEKQTTLVCFY